MGPLAGSTKTEPAHRKHVHLPTTMIYGLQRSGTNYLEALVNRRFRVRWVNNLNDRTSPAQKHFRLYENKNLIPEPGYDNSYRGRSLDDFETALGTAPHLYLVISKDPYRWLVSYRSWAQKCSWPPPSHHYIEEYAAFYSKWVEFAASSDRVCLIRYDDLLRAPEEELARVQQRGDLRRRWSSYILPMKSFRVQQSRRTYNRARKRAHESGSILEKLDASDFDAVRGVVDPRLMHSLGYEYVEPGRRP